MPLTGLEALYLAATWQRQQDTHAVPPALAYISGGLTRDTELERALAVSQRTDSLGHNFPGTLLRWSR